MLRSACDAGDRPYAASLHVTHLVVQAQCGTLQMYEGPVLLGVAVGVRGAARNTIR